MATFQLLDIRVKKSSPNIQFLYFCPRVSMSFIFILYLKNSEFPLCWNVLKVQRISIFLSFKELLWAAIVNILIFQGAAIGVHGVLKCISCGPRHLIFMRKENYWVNVFVYFKENYLKMLFVFSVEYLVIMWCTQANIIFYLNNDLCLIHASHNI